MKSNFWLTTIIASGLLLPAAFVHAGTTVDDVNHYAYGANIGWLDWRGDTNNGAVIGLHVCSGYIYSANVGWINLGNGAPANGQQYQNDSATDFGVNRDVAGNLRGYAYGANIGWIQFEASGAPMIDPVTGEFGGAVYSANCGWISLSTATAFGQSTVFAGNAGAASSEFSSLTKRVTGVMVLRGGGGSGLAYTVQANTNLAAATWINIGTATAAAGGKLQFTDTNAPNFQQRFYRFANP